jgi:hypothetical protein
MALSYAITPLVSLITFAVARATSQELSVANLFYALALLSLPKLYMAEFFVRGVSRKGPAMLLIAMSPMIQAAALSWRVCGPSLCSPAECVCHFLHTWLMHRASAGYVNWRQISLVGLDIALKMASPTITSPLSIDVLEAPWPASVRK